MVKGVLTLPIAQREMLVLAKSPAIFRARLTNSIALLVFGTGFGLVYHYGGLQVVRQVVSMLAFVLLTICLFVGVQLTADSIAKEKREGTLGLLFLTHQTPFQIVLGKLVAHGLTGFYSILILVPLASLIVIAGGIGMGEVLVFTLAGLNVMFFSAAVGLYASARNIDRKKAGASGTWIVVFFWWGVPVLVALANYLQTPVWLSEALGLFAVNGMFNSAFAGPRVRLMASPWLNVLCTHLMGWAFLGLAAHYLKRGWQDQPAKQKVTWRERRRLFALGKPEVRLRLRKMLLERNPYLWLAARDRFRSWTVWGAMLGLLVAFSYIIWESKGEPGVIIGFTILLGVLHKVLLSGAAGHQLLTEQEQGTLEMLISTPLTVDRILKGQFAASVRQFRGPVIFTLVLQLAAAVGVLFWFPDDFRGLAALGLVCNSAMYLFDLYTLGWLGMWGALIARDAKHAPGAAMGRVLVLPALVFAAVVSAGVSADWYWKLNWEPGPVLVVAFWFLLGVVNNICWLAYVRKRLPERLQTFALKRYSPEEKRSLWKMLFSRRAAGSGPPPLLRAASQ